MAVFSNLNHPGGNQGANLKSISHICYPILVASVWDLTNETINLPLGCLQGGGRPPVVMDTTVLEALAPKFRSTLSL